jgi:hypothetical protein
MYDVVNDCKHICLFINKKFSFESVLHGSSLNDITKHVSCTLFGLVVVLPLAVVHLRVSLVIQAFYFPLVARLVFCLYPSSCLAQSYDSGICATKDSALWQRAIFLVFVSSSFGLSLALQPFVGF